MKKYAKGLICGMMILSMALPMGVTPSMVNTTNVYGADVNAALLEGKCGDDVKYSYNKDTKTLTISGTGEMWDETKFPKAVVGAENLIVEKGVTTIGAKSFSEGIAVLKNVEIADTVTTIKEYAFPVIQGEIEIPASVTSVGEYGILNVDKIIIKGDVKGYEFAALGNWADEIVLYGSAEDLGKASVYTGNPIITIAEGNDKCTVKNGCITSGNGKEIYYYISNASKVKISDEVEKIHGAAFYNKAVKQVTFGKSIKEIGDRAFQNTDVKTVKFPKTLKKVGEYAFHGAPVKSAEFNRKVTIGKNAFGNKVVIRNNAGIKKTSTSINKTSVSSNKIYVKYSKVAGASGYEIKVKTGKKTYKYTTTSTSFKKTLDKKIKDYYKNVEYEYEDNPSVAITVTVRPYKVVKGKKVYGKNSVKSVLEF